MNPHTQVQTAAAPPAWGRLRQAGHRALHPPVARGSVEDYYIRQFLDRHAHAHAARTWRLVDAAGVRMAQQRTERGIFDCVVCTQALAATADPADALRHFHALLQPGGLLLATLPGIAPARGFDDYWRFTSQSVRRLVCEIFPPAQVQVESLGNVLTAAATLLQRPAAQLTPAELEACDPDYQVVITVRAVRGDDS